MQSNQFRRRRALIQAGGTLAPFGEADNFVIGQMNKLFAGGIDIGGKKIPVTIIQKDSQSSPNRAGEVANDLILKEGALERSRAMMKLGYVHAGARVDVRRQGRKTGPF